MVAFTSKKIIKSQTLGDKLKEARMDRGYSLAQIAKELNIAFKYLEALENNKFSDLPGRAYLKNYLRAYSRCLKLDFGELWDEAKIGAEKDAKKFQAIDSRHFFVWSKFMARLGILLIVLILAAFMIWRVSDIFRPPQLDIIEPKDGFITGAKQIKLTGASVKEAEISINNMAVFVDNQGRFETLLDLQKGLNLIKISAKKRYSREKEVTLRVLQTAPETQ